MLKADVPSFCLFTYSIYWFPSLRGGQQGQMEPCGPRPGLSFRYPWDFFHNAGVIQDFYYIVWHYTANAAQEKM